MQPRFRSLSPEEVASRQQALRTLARRVLANDHDADDAVQEAWLAALREPESRVRNLDAWMTSVVRYQASRVRRRKLHREVHEREAATRRASSDDLTPAAAAADLERLVQRLPEPYRTVVWLRYFDDASVEEISAGLERPINTVKSQLRRAHELLRAMLDGEPTDERQKWRCAFVLLAELGSVAARARGVRPRSVVALAAVVLVLAAGVAILVPRETGAALVPSPVTEARADESTPVDGASDRADDDRTPLASPPRAAAGVALVSLRGRVIDETGKPVPDAAILLSAPDRVDAWSEVARSDRLGEFGLDGVDTRAWICADPRTGPPSTWHMLEPLLRFGAGVPIDLRVPAQRLLRGTVLGWYGRPVADAAVTVYANDYRGATWNDGGTWEVQPSSIATTTAADGTFTLDALSEGRLGMLVVRAAGYVPWYGLVERDKEAQLPLTPAFEVEGRVTSVDGSAVPAAEVRIEQDWPLTAITIVADADGRFRSSEVAGGNLVVRARDALGRSAVLAAFACCYKPVFLTVELGEASTLRGFARDHRGRPLSGWSVRAMQSEFLENSLFPSAVARDVVTEVHTGVDGSFAFPGRDAVDHVVWLTPPGDAEATPHAWRCGARPGGAPLELITDESSIPSAHFAGVIASAPTGTRVLAHAPAVGFTTGADVEPSTGRFAFGPLPPAAYELWVQVPGREPSSVASLELIAGQHADLGYVSIPEPGVLVLTVATQEAVVPKDLRAVLRSAARRIPLSPAAEDQNPGIVMFGPITLAAGSYALRVQASDFADLYRRIDVPAGKRVEIDVGLRSGTTTMLHIDLPRLLSPRSHVDLVIRSPDDTLVYDRVWPRSRDETSALRFFANLPRGDWLLQASALGWRGQSKVHVDAPTGEDPKSVRITLRPD